VFGKGLLLLAGLEVTRLLLPLGVEQRNPDVLRHLKHIVWSHVACNHGGGHRRGQDSFLELGFNTKHRVYPRLSFKNSEECIPWFEKTYTAVEPIRSVKHCRSVYRSRADSLIKPQYTTLELIHSVKHCRSVYRSRADSLIRYHCRSVKLLSTRFGWREG
jgi:hypothetical protein